MTRWKDSYYEVRISWGIPQYVHLFFGSPTLFSPDQWFVSFLFWNHPLNTQPKYNAAPKFFPFLERLPNESLEPPVNKHRGKNGNKIGFIDKAVIKRINRAKITFRSFYTRSKFRMQKREKIQTSPQCCQGNRSNVNFQGTESLFPTFVPIKHLTSVT